MFRNSSIWDDFRYNVLNSNNTLVHLIFINIGIFVIINLLKVFLELFQINPWLYSVIWDNLALSGNPLAVLFKPWTLITYMFVHAGFWHILWNMLILYWFGRIFQEYLGNKKLLSIFIMGGLAGAVLYLFAYQFIPMLSSFQMVVKIVGASAGVMAVLFGAATLLPDFQIRIILIGPVKLKYIALVLFVIDLISLSGSNAGGSFAHIGGAIFGFVYIKQLQSGNDLGKWVITVTNWVKNLFSGKGGSSKTKFKVHHSSKTKRSASEQEEIDRILDKIAESGYDSLTAGEKETLFKASKR